MTKKPLMRAAMYLLPVVVAVSAMPAKAEKTAGQPVVIESKKSYDDTVQSLKDTIKGKGMMIIAEANHKNMLAMIGVESPNSVTILFGKPEVGKDLLSIEPKAAIEMPLKIAIRDIGNKTFVIYYDPKYLFSHYKNKKLNELAEKMSKMVGMIAGMAAGTMTMPAK